MSQSDYIKYKRVSTQLYLDASRNQLPVFTAQNYLDYEQFQIQNTVKNTLNNYSLLTPSGEQIVFDMEKRVSNCPTFKICTDTNKRPNRVLAKQFYSTSRNLPSTKDLPLNWRIKKNASNLKNECNCSLNSINTLKYVCRCKTTF
jgi:hypothetical protein